MKSFIRFIYAVFFLLLSPILLAHEGHDHAPVNMKKAVEIALATAHGYSLTQPPFGLQILDKSWRNLPRNAAQIHENGRGYYVVSVTNPQQQTLYVRILLDATVTGANFSGKFDLVATGSSANSSIIINSTE